MVPGISKAGDEIIAPLPGRGSIKQKKKPTIELEVILDGERWVRGANFGIPGRLKFIKILDLSSIVESILTG